MNTPSNGKAAAGPQVSGALADALANTRRREFIPAVLREHRGGRWRKVDKARAPRAWAQLVHGPEPVVFDVNDGRESGGPVTGLIPSMADATRRVGLLDAEPGMRVAEIGTDSGWVAALLQHLVRHGTVRTVADTPRLADFARLRLSLQPRVRVTSGPDEPALDGGVPYDGLIAHRAVQRIPWEWVSRVRPGGHLCLALRTGLLSHSVLLRLTVAADGHSANGRFYSGPWPHALWLRSDRPPAPPPTGGSGTGPRMTGTVTDPQEYLQAGVQLFCGLLHPELQMDVVRSAHPLDGDVADRIHVHDGHASRTVMFLRGRDTFQWGPSDLDSVLTDAVGRWQGAGRPAPEDFELTVTPTRHVLWSGGPGGPSWLLPPPAHSGTTAT